MKIYVKNEIKTRKGDGTLYYPFNSIYEAKQYVATINKNMTQNIEVVLLDDIYTLEEPLIFTADDSATNGYKITYKSHNQTFISGGRKITGFSKLENAEYWVADCENLKFRQLYVNGKRAVRARSKEEFRGIDYVIGEYSIHDGIKVSEKVIGDYKNQQDIELVWPKAAWRHFRHTVEKIVNNGDGTVNIVLKQPYYAYGLQLSAEDAFNHLPLFFRPFYIENALELLTEPGQWYYDYHIGKLYYYPTETDNMKEIEVIAPALEQLVILQGEKDNYVNNIIFENLHFCYATWNKPSDTGFATIQAGWLNNYPGRQNFNQADYVEGNVKLEFAKNISFNGGSFKHLGGCAIRCVTAVENIAIESNTFEDISEGAIQLGTIDHCVLDEDNIYKMCRNIKVINNTIKHIGVEYYSAVGILSYYPEGITISHNEMAYMPYSAISLGWGWAAYINNTVKNNLVEKNNIHDFLMVVMDGAAVYTLGNHENTIIKENYFHAQHNEHAAIYTDNGSTNITIINNVIENVEKSLFIWEPSMKNIVFQKNWLDNLVIVNDGTDCKIDNNYLYDRNYRPDEVVKIINESGTINSEVIQISCKGKYNIVDFYTKINKLKQINIDLRDNGKEINAIIYDLGNCRKVSSIQMELIPSGSGQKYHFYASSDKEKWISLAAKRIYNEVESVQFDETTSCRYLCVAIEILRNTHIGIIPISYMDIR